MAFQLQPQLRELPYDNFLEITNQMDDRTLLTYCSVDRTARKFCDDNFWMHRIHVQDLSLLLPYHRLYPSLKQFYLNVRDDAIYLLKYYKMENGRSKDNVNYFTEINSAHNALLTLRTIDTIKEVSISINILTHKLNIEAYYLIYTNKSIDAENKYYLNPLILQYPPLTARSVIFEALSKPPGRHYRIRKNATVTTLRENFGISSGYTRDLNLIKIGSMSKPLKMSELVYGYIFVNVSNRQMMIFLDYELVPNTNSNDYMIVIAPIPPIPGIITLAKRAGHPTGEGLLRHLEQHGSFYKFEDLPMLMDLIQ
jgi:hypothetical protein